MYSYKYSLLNIFQPIVTAKLLYNLKTKLFGRLLRVRARRNDNGSNRSKHLHNSFYQCTMPRLAIPPVTKYFLLSIGVLTLIDWFLRYYCYMLAANEYQHIHSSAMKQKDADFETGTNFPDGPKPIPPSINDYYVPVEVIVGNNFSSLRTPWVFLTASLVEEHILGLVMTGATAWAASRYFEIIWGSKELFKFLTILIIIPNILAYTFFICTSQPSNVSTIVAHDNENSWNGRSAAVIIHGGAAIVAGHLVAAKQLIPEHIIVLLKGSLKFRVKRLVPWQLFIASVLGAFGFHDYCLLTWLGFFTSWVYLRFLRISYGDPILPFSNKNKSISMEHFNSSSGIKIRGDAADYFSLAAFFPEPFNLIVGKITELFTKLFTKLKLYKPFTATEIEVANTRALQRLQPLGGTGVGLFGASNTAGSTAGGLPMVAKLNRRDEAERRRSLALKAFDYENGLRPPSAAVLPAPKAGKN